MATMMMMIIMSQSYEYEYGYNFNVIGFVTVTVNCKSQASFGASLWSSILSLFLTVSRFLTRFWAFVVQGKTLFYYFPMFIHI